MPVLGDDRGNAEAGSPRKSWPLPEVAFAIDVGFLEARDSPPERSIWLAAICS